MKTLIVYAHPNPKSFNHAILEGVKEALISSGHSVEVRDLYALGFDPILKPADFEALQKGTVSPDVATEQDCIRKADLLLFVYPIWWTGMPAILKGYIDRVMTHGFAYTIGQGGVNGLLKGKKAFLVSTTGMPREVYEGNGMYEALRKSQDMGIFRFCGLDLTDHVFLSGVFGVDDSTRRAWIQDLQSSLKKL